MNYFTKFIGQPWDKAFKCNDAYIILIWDKGHKSSTEVPLRVDVNPNTAQFKVVITGYQLFFSHIGNI